MVGKITSLAELRKAIEAEKKRHEEKAEQIIGQIGVNHGLLALELEDVLKLISEFEAGVRKRLKEFENKHEEFPIYGHKIEELRRVLGEGAEG